MSLSRKCDCFTIVVLQREDLGRIRALFYSRRSNAFPRPGHGECVFLTYSTDMLERVSTRLSSTSRSARSACRWETFSLNSFNSFLLDSISSPFSLSSLSRCSFSRSMIRSCTSRRRRRRIRVRRIESRGEEEARERSSTLQQLFIVTEYQVSIPITVALNFIYLAALTGSNSQQWF